MEAPSQSEPPFFPTPSALLTFLAPDGRPRGIPVGWVGIVCSRPSRLSLSFQCRGGLKCDFLPTGDFAINLPTDAHLAQVGFLERLADENFDILTEPGFSLTRGQVAEAPLIIECPVQVECRKGSVQSRFDHYVVSGEVACVHLGERCYGADRPVNLCRLDPFTALRRLFGGSGQPTLQQV
ncbi:hypothetical protein DESUT3_33960 [Desulfuromonas versatilis]|uniref:Flavin reductase like domain-containing protein n=1 Tax=Desulfuromonas versatilis TaxID=2802975 RepID=A0ABM8I072_9BACT|nr:flavin reductase [Desulfuromonas versatilis]BCR06327.1 hypothetical protein DESUT3_33960 [Desulfuromonas versatilis]